MQRTSTGKRWVWGLTAWGFAAALMIGGAVSCEHYRYWRGGKPWPDSFVEKVSTPAGERAALEARMAPPAPKNLPDPYESAENYIRDEAAGCISCHGTTDEPDMHVGRSLAVSCVDCHGGDGSIMSPLDEPGRPGDHGEPIRNEAYLTAMHRAHVQPRNPEAWYGRHHLQNDRGFGEHHAHKDPTKMHGSDTPENTYALLNQESPQFIRFINPGDLRIAQYACGACHAEEVANVPHSMMAHGSMLWGAALYNNGAYPEKTARFGENYSPFGLPQRLQGVVEGAEWNEKKKQLEIDVRRRTKREARNGVLPYLRPLPVWNISQPGNILRIFERGQKLPVPGGQVPNPIAAEPGNVNPLEEPGKPDKGLSPRGLGTLLRTDPVFLGLQKTRLLDPILGFMGTNDHPGDYRASGCIACHTPYANDTTPAHSGKWAEFGHSGESASEDPTIPKDESGHPIKHVLTNAVPSSQCITCHVHPGTNYANTYFGTMWWDNESDGEHMYPAESHEPTSLQRWRALRKNPEAAQLRGLWGNLYPEAESHAGDRAGENFLAKTGSEQFNEKLDHNQFADFHGHGWVFRKVYKRDKHGHLLDEEGEIVTADDPDKWDKAVHLQDVHLRKYGMHCVDCHFKQDAHGNGKLYGETRNAVEISCKDCHGTYREKTDLRTSGPAAPPGGTDMTDQRVGKTQRQQFFRRGGDVYQRSAMNPEKTWKITQTVDTIDPTSEWAKKNPEKAKLSRYAKTMQEDGRTWGNLPPAKDSGDAENGGKHGEGPHAGLAHSMKRMECYTCHTSWMTSCFGCHLPMKANERTPMLHNENLYTRNYTEYNYQVLRDDVFMLGHDGVRKSGKVSEEGEIKKLGKIVPVRSSSAVVVSSQNSNREWIYHQQQTVSAGGYSGQAFNPHYPHAVSGHGTTKMCTDCHVSRKNDNNAWMSQLTLQGTNFVNFFGRYVYTATGEHGLQAIPVTEHDEPQAVYGSHLHKLAYPDQYEKFVANGRDLSQGFLKDQMFHHGPGLGNKIHDLQKRGEYLYTARGPGGFHAYDIANIDNKGFSERITTAPVSPAGQDLGFDTENAVVVSSPATVAVDPGRTRHSSDPSKPRATLLDERKPWHPNMEKQAHPMYAYLYIGDSEEGLILTNAATLLDGDPANNFMERAELKDGSTAFNPDGILDGLTHLKVKGHYVYVTCDAGLVVIDIDQPLDPKVVATVGREHLKNPRCVQVMFRYAFVTDAEGLKVLEVSDLSDPQPVEGATVPLKDAHQLYVSRTYAFVAAGKQGLAIVDIEKPDEPKMDELFDAGGSLNDVRDVKVGMTNASLYAYVGDGENGMKVLNLMGPHTTPQFRGFAPPLDPSVIAHFETGGPALAISEGLDRDRAVDETGNQIAVFGRLGARPLTREEIKRMYMEDGQVWKVTDEPQTEPEPFTFEPKSGEADKPAPPPGAGGPPGGGGGPPGSGGGPPGAGGGPPSGGPP